MDMSKLYARVVVPGLAPGLGVNIYGTVIKIREDDRGEPIYTVDMDDKLATADGIYYARGSELMFL